MRNSSNNTTISREDMYKMSALDVKELLEKNRLTGWPDLSDKYKVFAHRYLEDFDHLAAAESVGIDRKEALRVLRMPLVSAYIEELKSEMYSRLKIDADMVKSMWLDVLPQLAGKESITKFTKDGPMMGQHFDGPSLVSALKEIGRMTDVYEQGSDPDKAPTTTKVQIEVMPETAYVKPSERNK